MSTGVMRTGSPREDFDLTGFPLERFKSYIQEGDADDCWEWKGPGSIFSGGHVCFAWRHGGERRYYLVHRLAYLLAFENPGSMLVCHACDNPRCCNPNHLFPGTSVDNRLDCVDKNRHATGQRNGRSKLSVDDVVEIRMSYSGPDHPTTTELALQYGVSRIMIGNIVSGRSWTQVGGPIITPRVGRRKSS